MRIQAPVHDKKHRNRADVIAQNPLLDCVLYQVIVLGKMKVGKRVLVRQNEERDGRSARL